jgi:asparagine synthase (glutamine-hydrolysing)
VTVVLTGEGADEVFLGYRGFFERAIFETRAKDHSGRSVSQRLRRLGIARSLAAPIQRLSLLLFEGRHRERIAKTRAGTPSPPPKPLVHHVQEARLAQMPLDILCFLGDREEMAHSLEARLPFLDHHLFDAARTIPVDLKYSRGMEKAVLREAAKGLLPDDIRLRRKSGFMMTSDAVDFGRLDRGALTKLDRYLSRQKFRTAQIFSYRSFRLLRLLTRVPPSSRGLRRIRETANKVIMYMAQVHMLHDMFVERPRWKDLPQPSGATSETCLGGRALSSLAAPRTSRFDF